MTNTSTPAAPVQTLSALVDELVARGWARQENPSLTAPGVNPDRGTWTVRDVVTGKGKQTMDLFGVFTLDGLNAPAFQVEKCPCCDRLAGTVILGAWGAEPVELAWLRGWVGLEMVAQVSAAVLAARRAQEQP